MIITDIEEVSSHDALKATWDSITAFQNVTHTAACIRTLHRIPNGHSKNIEKQASQIRFCLIQADEYFRAARSVTMATRPLLIYYGILSLALSEILIKQDGMSSLDAARGQHAHHGLDLRIAANPSLMEDLGASASAIRAVPMVTPKGRVGNFELWHRSAREAPVSGPMASRFVNNTTQEGSGVLLVAGDERLPLVPERGVSLLDCLRAHPGSAPVLSRSQIDPSYARARGDCAWTESDLRWVYRINFQPGPKAPIEACYDLISLHPEAVNRLNISEFRVGVGLRWEVTPQLGNLLCRFPSAIQLNVQDVYFETEMPYLNEFGILYIGMFMLGNYVRYFPEQWMHDVERSSPLALAAKAFTDVTEQRAPLLLLSELERKQYLLK